VNRLAGEGLLEFSSNPAHKRSELVTMTVAGKTSFAKTEHQEAEFMAGLVSRLPAADVTAASAVLRRIRELLSEEPRGVDSAKRGGQQAEIRSEKAEESQPKTTEVSRTAKVAVPEADESELPYNLL
jgi:hypothetical protein